MASEEKSEKANDQKAESLKVRYLRFSKIILLIAILYSIWIVFHIISIYLIGLDMRWAALSMEEWIFSAIVLLAVFIVFEILFMLHFYVQKHKKPAPQKKEPEIFKGKYVHEIIIPENASGGIFSKTYIRIDGNNLLKIKFQMIPPDDLWKISS